MKAALRVMVFGLSAVVKGAKMALDALPGGDIANKILEGIHAQVSTTHGFHSRSHVVWPRLSILCALVGSHVRAVESAQNLQCEIIIGGDKYGAMCFLEEVAKIAKLMQEVVNDIKARKFQDLVKYVADPQNLPHYGANDITDCVVKKVRAEYTCKPNTPKMQYLMAML